MPLSGGRFLSHGRAGGRTRGQPTCGGTAHGRAAGPHTVLTGWAVRDPVRRAQEPSPRGPMPEGEGKEGSSRPFGARGASRAGTCFTGLLGAR